jgi:hypothetical protein
MERSAGLFLAVPVPYSLFPVPCSLFPVPYSLFPISCSLFPIPCSLFPVPYFLFPIPYSLFPVPYSLHQSSANVQGKFAYLDFHGLFRLFGTHAAFDQAGTNGLAN